VNIYFLTIAIAFLLLLISSGVFNILVMGYILNKAMEFKDLAMISSPIIFSGSL